jgi:pyridoxal phosphate enzyme (YggS family)
MIADNLAAVRARIEAAATQAGRRAQDVTLVAVTKEVDATRVREAVALGVSDVGENRAQELTSKQSALAGSPVRWHMIGTMQRNKVPQVVGHVSLIHSVDSSRLANAIGRRAAAEGLDQEVLLEVNAGGEPTKHGIDPADALDVAEGLLGMEGLGLRGLMTIAPAGDARAARKAFRTLRELGARLQELAPGASELSMGMSDDFEIAIEEGATIVRIGSAIFGARAEVRGAKASG